MFYLSDFVLSIDFFEDKSSKNVQVVNSGVNFGTLFFTCILLFLFVVIIFANVTVTVFEDMWCPQADVVTEIPGKREIFSTCATFLSLVVNRLPRQMKCVVFERFD